MNALDLWKHSPLRNYIIPGLTSWLLVDPDEKGCVRLFEMTRHQNMMIAPHSHRFDFTCIVLRGSVINTIWTHVPDRHCIGGDRFTINEFNYLNKPGAYEHYVVAEGERFDAQHDVYHEGDTYSMKADQIHSIMFEKGSLVMFFEGPMVTKLTTVLDPYELGETIKLSATQPWMFKS